MHPEQSQPKISIFKFEGKEQPVSFVETMGVAEGVECDVYTFSGDKTKDLGIIRISPGCKTPLQRVLKGKRTIEGWISGKGMLKITKPIGIQEVHLVGSENQEPFFYNCGNWGDNAMGN